MPANQNVEMKMAPEEKHVEDDAQIANMPELDFLILLWEARIIDLRMLDIPAR